MASSRAPQTVLRVKRRRNENPPSTIRLELLDGWNVRRHDENDSATSNSASVHNNATFTNGNNSNNGVVTMMPAGSADEHNNNQNQSNGDHAYPLRSSSTATLADSSRHSAMSTCSTQTTTNVTTTNTAATTTRRTTTAAAVWKRVEQLEGDDSLGFGFSGSGSEKRCRVVDAVLEIDSRSTKRRKLTVLGESKGDELQAKSKKKHNAYRVLDPVTRLVDDSLMMVHAGDRSAQEHYSLITTDPRLATHARTWMVYTATAGGNLLHACAHWNDVEVAHDLLRQSLPGLCDQMDEDGRTPYETAQLCGHTSIEQVLEAFGADTTNFVYDLFVPQDIDLEPSTHMESSSNNNNNNNQAAQEDTAWNPLEKTAIQNGGGGEYPSAATNNNPHNINAQQKQQQQSSLPPRQPDLARIDTSRLLELQGGVGYWTEEGELILEVEPHHMMGMTAEFNKEHNGDASDDEYGDGDDIDSNCEDYGGNDYPDEDDAHWEEQFLREEPVIGEDDSDDSGQGYGHEDVW